LPEWKQRPTEMRVRGGWVRGEHRFPLETATHSPRPVLTNRKRV
jgi:hypothetical protein